VQSVRKIGQALGISSTSSFKVLKDARFKSFKPEFVQALTDRDKENRVEFGRLWQERVRMYGNE